MNNHTAARANLERAQRILEEARLLNERGAWNLVELSLKGALWWAGVDVPRLHDVGAILRQHTQRFPDRSSPDRGATVTYLKGGHF